ncbi:unnamed protein product [Amoebophrya sp. A120]|nr:unnamed protein product [Amoebophrya sp. A120]|eukprot:GSA120T00019045001.1
MRAGGGVNATAVARSTSQLHRLATSYQAQERGRFLKASAPAQSSSGHRVIRNQRCTSSSGLSQLPVGRGASITTFLCEKTTACPSRSVRGDLICLWSGGAPLVIPKNTAAAPRRPRCSVVETSLCLLHKNYLLDRQSGRQERHIFTYAAATMSSSATERTAAAPGLSGKNAEQAQAADKSESPGPPVKRTRVETHQMSEYAQSQVDKDFVNFSIGQPTPSRIPLEEFRTALHERLSGGCTPNDESPDPLMLQYGGTSTHLSVLASWLTKVLGFPVQKSELLFTNGNSHAIQFAARALCRSEDLVLMDDPTYFLVGDILRSHCNVKLLPCLPRMLNSRENNTGENDRADGDATTSTEQDSNYSSAQVVQVGTAGMSRFVEELEAYLKNDGNPRPRAVYTIPMYHNPTGECLSVRAAKKLVQLAHAYDFYILADEPYVLLQHNGRGGRVDGNQKSATTAGTTGDRKDVDHEDVERAIRTSLRFYDGETVNGGTSKSSSARVISMGSFSKIVAPGLRLGWLHADAELVQRVFVKDPVLVSGGALNPVASLGVTGMIESGRMDTYLAKLNEIYTDRARVLCAELQSRFGTAVDFLPPTGGYFLWLRFRDSRMNTHRFFHDFLSPNREKYGVGFLPGRRCSVKLSSENEGATIGGTAGKNITENTGAGGGPEDDVADGARARNDGHRFDAYCRLSWAFYEADELKEGVQRLHRAYVDYLENNLTCRQ